MFSHVLGQPRIGNNRDLKNYLEKFFDSSDQVCEDHLNEIKRKIIYNNFKILYKNEIDYINVGDFSFYDSILDKIFYFNFFPKRFNYINNNLNDYFSLARGDKNHQPMEMRKWFSTNYHYIVPEYYSDMKFFISNNFLKNDIVFSKIFKKKIKLILIGPITLLKIGKIKDNFLKNRLLLIPKILEIYLTLINNLNKNVDVIQIDEPILSKNLNKIWLESFNIVYNLIYSYYPNIIITFGYDNLDSEFINKYLNNINFFAIHFDNKKNKISDFKNLKFKYISLGIVDGQNIWINDIEKSWYDIKSILLKNNNNILLSTNSSLMHVPIDSSFENGKNIKKILPWLSFSNQKINELYEIKKIYENIFFNKKYFNKNFIKNIYFIMNKKKSKLIFIKKIQNKIRYINIQNFKYRISYDFVRRNLHQKYFKFNIFKTTTIGSFPQTKKIRKIRLFYKNNKINYFDYEFYLKREIYFIIKKQINYKFDVLVHGEPERNDMVEYFAENLKGFSITKYGWVQSYGSRYVKPPIIYGDIYIKNYMTINWIKYSQDLTKKPLKAMLTGPITMIKWSFRRNDQPNYITAIQISLILNKEIIKLEKLGIKIIQIDEPAIKEFLPIKNNNYKYYFNWSVKAFIVIFNKVKNTTQIHTHVCYSEFKNIINFIKDLNLDVISIETSRSDMEILTSLKEYKNDIGLGIYDIHSKRKLEINHAVYLLKLVINNIDINKIWINPDCGLKTRKWKEICESLKNITCVSNHMKSILLKN